MTAPTPDAGRAPASSPGLTIVTPWFGTRPAGGAQRLAARLAVAMAERGWRVTVASTTSEGHWADWTTPHFPAGEQPWPGDLAPMSAGHAAPVLVRFDPDPRRRTRFDAINAKFLNQQPVTLAEEEAFLHESINAAALLEWIATARPDDLVVTLPYCYGLTWFATLAFASRAVLVPCLHREGYARMWCVAELLERAAGLAFLSEEEEGLASALARIESRPRALLGAWVDGAEAPPPPAAAGERDAARRRFAGGKAYVAVVGWQDAAKGLSFLFECVADAARMPAEALGGAVPRVLLVGPGSVPVPAGLEEIARSLGELDEETKRAVVRGADWLVQPSLHESFSLVLMEAWREGTPALVNALCAVTRGHVVRAGGGLYFANGEELAAAIAWGRRHAADHAAMGRAGAAYVRRRYAAGPLGAAWDAFLRDRLAAASSSR